MSKYGLFMSNRGFRKEQNMDIIMSGHKSKSQKMDLNYVRTQVKIEKDGFDLCPDTSQNRKIWQLCLMDKFVLYGINFYSCIRYKLLCNYDSSSSSDTGSEEE